MSHGENHDVNYNCYDDVCLQPMKTNDGDDDAYWDVCHDRRTYHAYPYTFQRDVLGKIS